MRRRLQQRRLQRFSSVEEIVSSTESAGTDVDSHVEESSYTKTSECYQLARSRSRSPVPTLLDSSPVPTEQAVPMEQAVAQPVPMEQAVAQPVPMEQAVAAGADGAGQAQPVPMEQMEQAVAQPVPMEQPVMKPWACPADARPTEGFLDQVFPQVDDTQQLGIPEDDGVEQADTLKFQYRDNQLGSPEDDGVEESGQLGSPEGDEVEESGQLSSESESGFEVVYTLSLT